MHIRPVPQSRPAVALALLLAVTASTALAAPAVADPLLADPPPTGSVALTAVDEVTGAPVANFCSHQPIATQVCSDGTGQVLLHGFPPGLTRINVLPQDGQHWAEGFDVEVVADTTVSFVARMRPAAMISVRFRDAGTGAPVPRACAYVVPVGQAEFYGSRRCADAQGLLRYGLLETGRYVIFADPANQVHGRQWVGWSGGTGDRILARVVHAKAGPSTTIPDIRLDRAGTISGVVTARATGAPVGGAVVALNTFTPEPRYSDEIPEEYAIRADGNGRYTFTGLGPYAWPLQFSAAGQAHQWSGGAPSRLLAERIRVRAGQVTRADHSMRAGTVVSGQIHLKEATDPAQQVVAHDALTGDVIGVAPAHSDYRMTVLTNQVIKLFCICTGYSPFPWYRASADFAHATPVLIGRRPVTVDLRPWGDVPAPAVTSGR